MFGCCFPCLSQTVRLPRTGIVVGPPPEVDWNAVWNGVLHLWSERIKNFYLQMHTPIHGLISHAKATEIWPGMLPLYLHIGGFNVCCRGILLVLVAWVVHDILGIPNFLRLASTHIFDRRGSGLDDVVWNSHLASCVNSCRKYLAIVYILCFLSLHRETCLPHACRPGLTWFMVGGGDFWLPGSTGLTVSAGEGLFIPWNCVFSGVLQFLHFGRCILLLE